MQHLIGKLRTAHMFTPLLLHRREGEHLTLFGAAFSQQGVKLLLILRQFAFYHEQLLLSLSQVWPQSLKVQLTFKPEKQNCFYWLDIILLHFRI